MREIMPKGRITYLLALTGGVLATATLMAPQAVAASASPDRPNTTQVTDRAPATQGWNFKLHHRSSPDVVATGRLQYSAAGGPGCFTAFATGQLKTRIGDPAGRDANFWLVGRDCQTGRWVRLLASTSPSAGVTSRIGGKQMANVKDVSVAICSTSGSICTIPDPSCPTCGGKQQGDPNAAAREEDRRKEPTCTGPKACPVPGGPEWRGVPPLSSRR